VVAQSGTKWGGFFFGKIGGAILFALTLAAFTACSGSDESPQEPVAPQEDPTGYPEDPALAGQMPSDADEKADATGDLPGPLTDDPFNGAPPPSDAPIDPEPEALADDGGMPAADDTIPTPDAGDNVYGDSFDDKPDIDPTLDNSLSSPGGDVSQPKPGKKHKAAKSKKSQTKKVSRSASKDKGPQGSGTRYVNAIQLNVRENPNLRAPIVSRLLGGTKVKATAKGEWAQLEDGTWVKNRYLSKKPTKKVTEEDVAKAWSKSKYKDTWQPPQ
jgi:hypothetical protein